MDLNMGRRKKNALQTSRRSNGGIEGARRSPHRRGVERPNRFDKQDNGLSRLKIETAALESARGEIGR